MKVYVADGNKVDNYLLPSKVEDSFLIPYTSTKDISENIVLNAENGHWTIHEAKDFTVRKGVSAIPSDIIANGNFYDIKFEDIDESIKMYCFDIPMKYNRYSIADRSQLTLGKTNADIIYNTVEVGTLHFTITRNTDSWFFNSAEGNTTYINGLKCDSCQLLRGDILFINGLKIIWMETFLLINDLGDKVKIQLTPYKSPVTLSQPNVFTPVTGSEKFATLYNDNQIFFHTPRLNSSYLPVTIKIINPPEPFKNDSPPAILTLGTTIMMGISSSITGIVAIFSVVSGEATLISALTEVLLCITMIIGSVFFPIVLDKYQKRKIKKKESTRQKKYLNYLDKKKKLIIEEMAREKTILIQNHLSYQELLENIKNSTNKVWSREISDDDFLTLRLGIGNQKANIKIDCVLEDFHLEDDNLRDEVEKIKSDNIILNDVPVTVSLIENTMLPIIISKDIQQKKEIIDNIMLQLITYYSAADLKIAIFTDEYNAYKWEYLKYSPYNRNDSGDVHYFATNDNEMKQLSNYLENIYVERSNKDFNETANYNVEKVLYKNFEEYYLIITDNYITTKKYGIIDKILNSKENLGFSVLMIESSLKAIPSKCNVFVQITPEKSCVINKDLNLEQKNFVPDYFQGNIANTSLFVANIPVRSASAISQLPTSIQFLELYQVGKVDQLNVINRWAKNDPTISLATPIGVHPDGKLFELDLHEKYHGPHGLIAGSTGSGKSEFIITFILSMAINYHPDEVQFVLIDYKGGGLAGAFENRETGVKIPHLVGTITNLDTGEMNRTLVSINSELKRRQRMFNEARDALGESTVDIYKYQNFYRNGKVKEPISHLFIISDEFAELKAQQPDFMDQLISTARIGRSLGVHLILATQKPSGVVNDQIWSNSRFKICLKVQTSEDSVELLKRNDAASIKETGRFYLQVGYDELFEIGQSAWSGAKYFPMERIEKSVDDDIKFIDNNGNIIRTANNITKVDKQINYGDQLTNIVKNLYDIAKRENIAFRQLWLPSIPEEIYLSNIIKKYNYTATPYLINPVIGEYDMPEMQLQNILTIDFTNSGNLIIYGNPGSGKENLITTTLYSICAYHSTDEINIYIMDFGAEVLKVFNNVPQVGDIIYSEDKEKLRNLFLMLDREINRRKEMFSNYNGSYASYINESGNKLPLILVVLNGFDSFYEVNIQYFDLFVHLVRESSKYGIIFIISAIATNSVPSRISNSFQLKIAMQLNDPFDYQYYLNAPHGLSPSKYFGRGVVSMDETAYEFQTCYIYLKDQINQIIRTSFEKVNYSKARPIPIIPRIVNSDTLSPYIDSIEKVPIGINVYDATIYTYNFSLNKITQIIGNNLLTENDFLKNFVTIFSAIPNIKMEILDFMGNFPANASIECIKKDFTKKLKEIELETNLDTKKFYIILGIGYIYDKVLDEGVKSLFNVFQNINKYTNSYFIFADNYSSYKRIMKEVWYNSIVQANNGIWIGKGVDNQNAINVQALRNCDINEEFNGLAYSVIDQKYQLVKVVGDYEDDD